ncbi:sulfite exporter TauE/SafE family protein [Abyssalbus ytuae]|uniref:Probable membrane transporter protein n=1 Tax=Abyssalbus ytuae TaxID=2926907 RepID=A0A9E6ZQQ2_9FLAO|nr:sulfite exporter TauE/SafE family protein [Abyssalbus ytuae]UOB16153.1 sulfite exporter TauE/SafE family protein [Abyssalbus ytuae]
MFDVFGQEINMVEITIYFLIGSISSFYGSITGGAGMLSVPVLIFMGIPVETVIATIKLGDLGRFSFSVFRFFKSGKIVWKYALPFIPLALLGGVIGAKLLVVIDKDSLHLIIGILVLLMVPIIIINKKTGVEQVKTKPHKVVLGYLIYFLLAIYGASVQIGSGPLIIYALIWLFGLTIIQSNATSSVAWIFITISSLISLIFMGMVNFYIGIPLLCGSALGGYLGANTAIKKGDKWTKNLFALVVLIMGVKIIYEWIK